MKCPISLVIFTAQGAKIEICKISSFVIDFKGIKTHEIKDFKNYKLLLATIYGRYVSKTHARFPSLKCTRPKTRLPVYVVAKLICMYVCNYLLL